MKILIWVLCVFVYSVVETAFKFSGITLGGLPSVLLSVGLVFVPAPLLTRAWQKRKQKKAEAALEITPQDEPEIQVHFEIPPPEEKPEPTPEEEQTPPSIVVNALPIKTENTSKTITITSKKKLPMSEEPPKETMTEKPLRRTRIKKTVIMASAALLLCALSAFAGVFFSKERFTKKGYDEGWVEGNETGINAGFKKGTDEGYKRGYSTAESTYARFLQNNEEDIEKLKSELSESEIILESCIDYLYDSFYLNSYIGVIVKDGTRRYHTARSDCTEFYEYKDYQAYNIEHCQSLGYTACPLCTEDDLYYEKSMNVFTAYVDLKKK